MKLFVPCVMQQEHLYRLWIFNDFSSLFGSFLLEPFFFVLFGAMSDPDCLYGTFFMVDRMCEIDKIQIPEGWMMLFFYDT